MKVYKLIICIIAILFIHTHSTEAGGTKGGSTTSSSSSSTSSSARSSNAALNASRINAVSRMNTTSRMSSMTSRNQSINATRAATLARPLKSKFKDPVQYRAAHHQYVNNHIFYGTYYGSAHSTNHQRDIIKQLLQNDIAYTIEVEHNGKKRLYVVSKEVYEAIHRGDTVHIKNGVVTIKK